MAYYSSSYYQSDDLGQYYSTPYEPSTQNLFAYDPNPYYHAFHSTPTLPNISYYASAYSEPMSIEFNPKIHEQSYDTDVTKFVISYSVSEFNEPEFEEYDPTPYGGGFDLAQVYGKPLSPSDKTCYPRSSAPAGLNAAPTLNGVKEESVEQVPQVKPLSGIQEVQVVEKEQGKGNQIEESVENRESQEYEKQGKGNQIEESGENRGSFEYEKQGNQMPSGYGLEAMDICESLFGYWPCLAKDLKRNGNGTYQEICGEGMYGNPWKATSDYLFGSSNPYRDTRDECNYYGGSVYAYETHYLEQTQDWQG